MESAATRTLASRPRPFTEVDLGAVAIWILVGGLVLYLATDGGGYGVVAHSQVGILVWWGLLIGAAAGLFPAARPSRAAWVALALFGGFIAWTALGLTWSISSERTLTDLSLVAGYLGVLVLGVSLHRDRDRALRHTLAALAAASVIVAALALASRLRPGLFPAAAQTSSFLPGTSQRLGWPLNYWNALAALMAFAIPLLIALATSARTLFGQAAAAAGIPIVVLTGYLTFSRGGVLAAAIAVLVFLALAPARFPKLATTAVAAGGSAALIAGASTRHALERGYLDAAARHQGQTLVLPILLVCAGVALAQVGIGLASRHGTPPRLLMVTPRRARLLLGNALAALIVAVLLLGVPAKLSHAWHDFKNPNATALQSNSLTRFSSVSSHGRYEMWNASVHATHGHLLAGSGPGTFQLLWLPRAAKSVGYVQNAHSLYFETLAELGVVGLALLVAFLALLVGCTIMLVIRSRHEQRVRAAGAAAALTASLVSAGFDWIWQVPVLPVAFLLLGAAVIAPPRRSASMPSGPAPVRVLRTTVVLAALACLVAIGLPLATTNAVQASQTAASRGDLRLALRDAKQAASVEPDAASPQVQLALVEEQQGDVSGAVAAARRAIRNEPANWSSWLILSRLEAEHGEPTASVAAFLRARSLNPRSAVFANVR